VAIGAALEAKELGEAIGVPASGLSVTMDRRARFDAAEFLSRTVGVDADLEVWVDATDPARVQLYFVDRRTARYALRTLTLSGAMNEMDLEALAQAISWSLRALRGGGAETLAAAEAASALDRRAAGTASSAPAESGDPAPAEEHPRTATRAAPDRAAAPPWRWWGAAFYSGSLHSSEFGVVHGPGLGVGFDRSGPGASWGLRLGLQLQWPATYEGAVTVDLTSLATRVGAHLIAASSRRFRWGIVAGPGLDAAWVATTSPGDPAFVAAGSSVGFVPLLHLSLFADLLLTEHLLLEAALGIDVDLFSVHYDVIDAGVPETVVTRLPVHPTLTLSVHLP